MSNSNPASFDFRKRVAYDDDAKRLFHRHASRQLRLLADALGLAPSSFDLRNNRGGLAVSGEITMHCETIYVQACQPATGHNSGAMFRTCQGRKDYTGDRNNFASLDLLNDPGQLARTIRAACRA
jgi:hypothetical protein